MKPLTDDPRDYCFFDTETRALEGLPDHRWGDVTLSGAGRYSRSSKVVLFEYAIGPDEPVDIWELKDFDKTLRWIDAPPNLQEFMARALRGEAWFVAWNSGFDRNVCNHGMVRASKRLVMPVRVVLDAMAQAVASNLPAGLDRAHKAIGGAGKLEQGKHLIQKFCVAGGDTPQSNPGEWEEFVEYGAQDVEALREVFLNTHPLFDWEWEQFWSSEVINDRGLPIDRNYVERAAYLSGLYQREVDVRVQRFTHYDPKRETGLRTVNQHIAMAQYVYDALEHLPEASSILTKRYSEDDEGQLLPDKVSVERARVEKLIALLDRRDREGGLTDEEFDILQLLEVREFGASATPKKFAKMLPMLMDNDRLPGQYVFNGAQQTGRFSSRGVQMHNLTRKALKDEAEAIEAILDIEVTA